MTGLDPALIRIDKARLHHARIHDAPRLTRALDQLSPASLGLSPRATLIVRRLALRTPLARSGPVDRFVAQLRDDLRARIVTARRGQAGNDDLLFEDDVALEAAIVAEWLKGHASGIGQSWIHAIGAGNPLARWRRHILPDQQLLPRIIARLVEVGHAGRWLAQFDPAEIRASTAQLLARFGATPIPIQAGAMPIRLIPSSMPQDSRPTRPNLNYLTRVAAEARTIARPDIRQLVALALIIARHPALIATSGFIESLDRFVAEAPPASAASVEPLAIETAEPTPPSVPIKTSPRTPPKPLLSGSIQSPLPPDLTRQPSTQAPKSPAPVSSLSAPAERPVIQTDYGGLFFLINVFLALKLYGDFTRPADGLKGLSPFELMYLLGTRWFGTGFASDPIAPLLVKLAGLEPGEKPGRLFEPPIWSVPDDWLLPWPDTKRTRLGYLLTDNQPVTKRRWINNLARYLAARLQRALDHPDAVAITCTQPGRVTLDRDRIDVRFPLADHPIALRFAGLDRDPGWVPAAAHFIEFSFT